MIADPWWAGYVAGVVTVMGPSVVFLALVLYLEWRNHDKTDY